MRGSSVIVDGAERRLAALVEEATRPIREEYERRLAEASGWWRRRVIKREMRGEIERVAAEVKEEFSGEELY